MASYDYKAGKKRIDAILNNKLEVIEQEKIPSEKEFTFENGYYSWVTGLFVDIRDSTSLFSNEDKEKVSKIIRSFTSEIIEILRVDQNVREVGIRGDCVYGIYATPKQQDEFEIACKAFYINTFIEMLDSLLLQKKYPLISIGIGVATAQELVVKAGRKDIGINNLVWIGDAVTKASGLSSLGNKNGINPIVFSKLSYDNFIDVYTSIKPEARGWFKEYTYSEYGTYYHANIIIRNFNDWINGGMKE